MALQIAPDGHLVMRLPRRLPEKEAFKFAMSHEGWIGRNYRKVTEQKRERPVYGEEEIRAFIEMHNKKPGAGTPGFLLCISDESGLWKNYNPEPEDEMGKLQFGRQPEF